jgi:phage repressor protein C with HTH and peptisase S24 domain
MSGIVEDGDVLFVQPVTSFDSDGLYVLSVDALLRVKRLRLRMLDRQLSIESGDGSPPELASLDDVGRRVLIHGRVVGAWSLKRV